MSFRKEHKYRLTQSDQKLLKASLLSEGMSMLYPSRSVNSCYFDTSELNLFHESEEGILPRKKIRIRWYDNEKKLTKEIKISSIEGRFKSTNRFYDENFTSRFDSVIRDQHYGLLTPSLLVSYQREYYFLKNLRITFDSNIIYRDIRKLSRRVFIDPEGVMEIKAAAHVSDDYIQQVISYPTIRFSKYSRGILSFEKLL